MEPLYYVMAIMGCGDAGTACQQVRVEPARYQSAVQCQVAMSATLERHTDLEYPVISATCQRNGVTMASKGERSGG